MRSIAEFPPPVRKKLDALRKAIHAAAPEAEAEAEEKISFCIPMFAQEGKLAHFAAYKKHIGFHPGPAAILAFRERLAEARTSSGTIQFPLDRPVPLDLIKDIISFKVRVNLETARLR